MLTDAKFISSIDLRKAFWQIPLNEESKEKTSFSVPGRGLFEFEVMRFGLCNAAKTQQRLVDTLFGPKYEPRVFSYLDDILITSKTFEEHIQLLSEVKNILKDAGLTINLEKCEFFPLNELLKGKKKKQQISWTLEAEESFRKIKEALVSAPILSHPDFSKQFFIHCDASDTGIGGVLTQEIDGYEQVIAYASRSLSRSERNMSITERECLSVIFSIEKFKMYVEGVPFTVYTDHHSLLCLNNIKSPTGRLARWAIRLRQHTFTLVHRKGSSNVMALSRITEPVQLDLIDIKQLVLDKW